jgi:hypothetical protein
MFTAEELRFIERAVSSYLEHPELSELRRSIQNKIRDCGNYAVTVANFNLVAERLRGREDLALVTLDENAVPVLRFVKCPQDLVIKDILPFYHSNQSLVFAYHNNAATVSNSIGSFNKVHISLNRYESELLIAFLLFHKLREKGIDYSGLTAGAKESSQEAIEGAN